jgi:hypothetical protein
MCQPKRRRRSSYYSLNCSASKQAGMLYTSFLSSQSPLFSTSNSCIEPNSLSEESSTSSPIHLDLLQSNFRVSDIYPIVELHQVVGNSCATACITSTQEKVSREIKQIEATFQGRSPSSNLVLLVQVYLCCKNRSSKHFTKSSKRI